MRNESPIPMRRSTAAEDKPTSTWKSIGRCLAIFTAVPKGQQVARAPNSYEQTTIEYHLFGPNHGLTEVESPTRAFRLNELGPKVSTLHEVRSLRKKEKVSFLKWSALTLAEFYPTSPIRRARSWKRGSERRGSKPGRSRTPGLNRSS